jgi:hypothetical protein
MNEDWDFIVKNTNIIELIKQGIINYHKNTDNNYSEEDSTYYFECGGYYSNNQKSYEEYILSCIGEEIAIEIYNLKLNNEYYSNNEKYQIFINKLENDSEFFITDWGNDLEYIDNYTEEIYIHDNIGEFFNFDNIINKTNIKKIITNHCKNFVKYL